MGKDNSIKSLTSLAYDCRRADMFRGHLFDALRLIERGDLAPADMLGSWAGELGQTQMMPSEYIKWAVDYDGDGKRNLLRSVPDVIGSTANYLVSLGWKRGEPWLEEVRVPAKLPWDQADLTVQHPRSQWAKWGVTRADGRALQNDGAQGLAAAADGPVRPGLPRLRQFPGLPEVELFARLLHHRRLLRDPPCRRAGDAARQRHAAAVYRRADQANCSSI